MSGKADPRLPSGNINLLTVIREPPRLGVVNKWFPARLAEIAPGWNNRALPHLQL
jgi:hypothetical protein